MVYTNEILVSPYTAIRLFAKTYLRFKEQTFTDRRFKVTREAWIASMFLIGLNKHSKSEWWFSPVTDSGSPDFNSYSFVRSSKGDFSERQLRKLEVFEWRKEDNEAIFIKALERIKLKKIVDPEITILCYIRRNTVIPPAIKLYSELKEINPKVKDIWYLGDVSKDSSIWRVTQLYPNTLAINLDYDEILNTKEDHSFLHAYRGKSDKVEYEPTGKQVLLSPEFKFKIVEKDSLLV